MTRHARIKLKIRVRSRINFIVPQGGKLVLDFQWLSATAHYKQYNVKSIKGKTINTVKE